MTLMPSAWAIAPSVNNTKRGASCRRATEVILTNLFGISLFNEHTAKSLSIPRHWARVKSGSSLRAGAVPGAWLRCLVGRKSRRGPVTASGSSFIPMLPAPARSGRSRRRVELQFSLRAAELMTLRNPRMGAIYITAACCRPASGEYPSPQGRRMEALRIRMGSSSVRPCL